VGGSSAGDVWAAGADGVFLHRDAAGWSVSSLPAPLRVEDVSGNWAVARNTLETASVLRLDGAAWEEVRSAGDLRGVFAVSDDDVWMVGHGSTILHLVGGNYETPSAPAGDWFGVAGGYIVGRGGAILKDLVAETSGVSVDLFDAWVTAAGEVYAVGDYGTVLHREGGAWVRQPAETNQPLYAVWGSASGELYAAGRDGVLLHATGLGQLGCAADGDCAASQYCDATGSCRARKAQGASCDAAADCKTAGCRVCSGALFCTDGVCCVASAADCGGCRRCSAPTGTCDPVPNGQDPRGTCAGATGECQQTTCNGQGGCGSSGQPCGNTTCAGGTLTTHSCQLGVCSANAPITCPSPVACADGMSCLGGCATDADCPATDYCDNNGLCATRKAQGGACDTTSHCKVSGCRECNDTFSCVDGYCCNGPCSGACEACDVGGSLGTCTNVPSGQPHGARGNCPGAGVGTCGGYCDGSGAACHMPAGVCNAASCAADGYTLHQDATCDTATGTCPARIDYDCGMDQRTCVAGACARCNLGGTCPPIYPVCNQVTRYCAFKNGDSCADNRDCGSNVCVPETRTCCNADCPPNMFACDVNTSPSINRGYMAADSCAPGVGLCHQTDFTGCNGYICQNRSCLTSCTCAVGSICSSPLCAPGYQCRGNTGDGTCFVP
jgi:hypothetical protein